MLHRIVSQVHVQGSHEKLGAGDEGEFNDQFRLNCAQIWRNVDVLLRDWQPSCVRVSQRKRQAGEEALEEAKHRWRRVSPVPGGLGLWVILMRMFVMGDGAPNSMRRTVRSVCAVAKR